MPGLKAAPSRGPQGFRSPLEGQDGLQVVSTEQLVECLQFPGKHSYSHLRTTHLVNRTLLTHI